MAPETEVPAETPKETKVEEPKVEKEMDGVGAMSGKMDDMMKKMDEMMSKMDEMMGKMGEEYSRQPKEEKAAEPIKEEPKVEEKGVPEETAKVVETKGGFDGEQLKSLFASTLTEVLKERDVNLMSEMKQYIEDLRTPAAGKASFKLNEQPAVDPDEEVKKLTPKQLHERTVKTVEAMLANVKF